MRFPWNRLMLSLTIRHRNQPFVIMYDPEDIYLVTTDEEPEQVQHYLYEIHKNGFTWEWAKFIIRS